MPRKSARRCSVKKLFKAMDKDGSGTVSLSEVKKAFAKAAGKDQLLTYREMQTACRKYAGHIDKRGRGAPCLQDIYCQRGKSRDKSCR